MISNLIILSAGIITFLTIATIFFIRDTGNVDREKHSDENDKHYGYRGWRHWW